MNRLVAAYGAAYGVRPHALGHVMALSRVDSWGLTPCAHTEPGGSR